MPTLRVLKTGKITIPARDSGSYTDKKTGEVVEYPAKAEAEKLRCFVEVEETGVRCFCDFDTASGLKEGEKILCISPQVDNTLKSLYIQQVISFERK